MHSEIAFHIVLRCSVNIYNMALHVMLQDECDAVQVDEEDRVASYLELQQQLTQARRDSRAVVNQPRYILPFLQPGRLVNVAASASGEIV